LTSLDGMSAAPAAPASCDRSSLRSRGPGAARAGPPRATPSAAAPVVPVALKDPDALLEGWLRKRGVRIPGHWSERYFVLKDDRLLYYLKASDAVARGAYILDRTCVVSEVKPYTTSYDKRKTLHAFRIVWPEAVELMEGFEGGHAAEHENPAAPVSKEAGPRTSNRFVGPLSAMASLNSLSLSSTLAGARNAQSVEDTPSGEASMDPHVLSTSQSFSQTPHPPQSTTKIIRSANSFLESNKAGMTHRHGKRGATSVNEGAGYHRAGSSVANNNSTATLATGGAMVAMAVGGVVVGAMTAGLGLVAPMVVVGLTAATGSGAAVYGAAVSSSQTGLKTKQVALVLASESKESAKEWRSALEAQIRWSQSFPGADWLSMVGLDRRLPARIGKGGSFKRSRRQDGQRPSNKLDDVERWGRAACWRPWGVYNGLRVYEIDHVTTRSGVVKRPAGLRDGLEGQGNGGSTLFGGRRSRPSFPCRKLQLRVGATPLQTFIALVSVPCRVLNGVIERVRNVEHLDDQTDVIHLSLKPFFFWPTWTAPRDFCLLRSWRYDEDGTYVICYDSTIHPGCPPVDGFVRGSMHSVYTISPKRRSRRGIRSAESDEAPESLLTHILQVDPRGWIWHRLGYLDAFIVEMLCQGLDVRDLLEAERFMTVNVDTDEEGGTTGTAGRGETPELGAEAGGATSSSGGRGSGTLVTHRPTVPADMWGDIDASSFVVRGPNYAATRLKIPSAAVAFRLLAVDLFELPEAVQNIAGHPNNRVQAAMAAGDCPSFVFVVQLQIPGGEQQLGYVTYFAPTDLSVLEEDTPLARLLKPFFFGRDDGYRDLRFKLIPKIVEGNWVVRKSVGSTPAILGTKLKQTYHKGTNYFELDVNIASSSVAAGVVRLAAGYAKTLVVDLALVIQGEAEDELPERVLAGWRINHMDLASAKRLE